MNHSGDWTPYLQLDDRNGIRGIYGAQLWDDTPYPTELLGAWRLKHPETGQTLRWTASHLRWIDGIPSVSFREGAMVGIGARAKAIWSDWGELETHIIRLYSDTECTELAGLYEGVNRFTGWLFIGTHQDEEGYCTQWPESRQYEVEWWREPAP